MLLLPAVPLFHARRLENIVGYVPATYNLMDSGQDFRPDLFGLSAVSHTWSTTNASITTGVLSPAGDLTAQKLVEGSANSAHRVYVGSNDGAPGTNTSYLSVNQIDAVVWRLACIAQSAGRSRIVLNVAAGFTGAPETISVGFDLDGVQTGYNNVAGAGWTIVGTPSIQPIGAGWCLCMVDFTFAAANPTVRRNPTPYINLDNGSGTAANSVSYAGGGAAGVNLWWFNLLPRGAWSLSNTAFFDDFKSLSTIDVNDTRASGFNWYPHNDWPNNSMYNAGNASFFRSSATPSNYYSLSDSILTMTDDISTFGSSLTTAATAANPAGYVGQVWPLSFLMETKAGWDWNIGTFPVTAFWGTAIEELTGAAPLNGRFTEIDFYEGGAGNPGSEPFGPSSSIRTFKTESYVGNVFTQVIPAGAGTDYTTTRHLYSSMCLGPADNDGVWGAKFGFFNGVMTSNGDGHWSAIAAYNASDSGLHPFGFWGETNFESFPIIIGTGTGRIHTMDWVKVMNNPSPPPVLYAGVATVTGQTTVTIDGSAVQSGGTLYWIVCTSAVIPTAAQIQAGLDSADVAAIRSGSQSVAATGAQPSISVTGLAVGTAYSAFVVQNKSGVLSNIDGPPPFTTFDVATTAWAAAVVSNGGTVSIGRENIINNLIAGLRADGLLVKLDRLWIFAAENAASALTDLVARTLATTTGSPPFTADRGYTGTDAATAIKYIDTGFNPNVSGVAYTLNSAHCSAWCVGNVAVSNGGVLIGTNVTGETGIYDTLNDGNIYARINEVGAGGSGAPGTRAGHWIVDRATAGLTTAYQNGTSFATPNQASTAIPTATFTVLCRHGAGVFQNGNPNQVAMASLGGHLSAADVTKFYNRLRTYMTAVGVP